MAIEHNVISDGNGTTTSERHEPKGASIALSGQMYISDGAGSGSWRYIPHSFCYYDDLGGSGTTIGTPTAYTLINPATTGDSDPHEFTHNSAGRLTYTGSTTLDMTVHCSLTVTHSSASAVDIYFQLHKNGTAVTGAQQAASATSGNFVNISLTFHVSLAQNDYIELYTKTASGSVVVWAFNMFVRGTP